MERKIGQPRIRVVDVALGSFHMVVTATMLRVILHYITAGQLLGSPPFAASPRYGIFHTDTSDQLADHSRGQFLMSKMADEIHVEGDGCRLHLVFYCQT